MKSMYAFLCLILMSVCAATTQAQSSLVGAMPQYAYGSIFAVEQDNGIKTPIAQLDVNGSFSFQVKSNTTFYVTLTPVAASLYFQFTITVSSPINGSLNISSALLQAMPAPAPTVFQSLLISSPNVSVNGLAYKWPSSENAGCFYNDGIGNITFVTCSGGGSSGFPIVIGSTSIAASSTNVALTGLSVNGVTLNSAGSTTLFLNQAGGYTAPAGGSSGLSGMTANQVPIAATPTTITSSFPIGGPVSAGNVFPTATTATPTPGDVACWTGGSASLADCLATSTIVTLAGTQTLTNKTLTSPTLTTPALGTPTALVLTNATGLPISGITGFGTGIATFLATPTSADLAAALTDETGTGSAVFATSPTLVTPILGTPTSVTLTNATGLPIAGITGLATGIGTFLATPTSANLLAALTTKTGTGSSVFSISPAFTGTPDASGATQFKLPVTAAFVSAANGELGYDSTNLNWHVWDNGVDNFMALFPVASPPTTGHCAEFVKSSNTWTLADAGAACGSGGGTPAYPLTITGGVSGGVVYGSSSTALTVSAAGTVNVLMKWGGAGAAPGSSSITDNGTTIATSEALSAASFASTADGVHPSYMSWVGNTTLPSITANTFGILGPSSATFTAYALQFANAGPSAASVLCAATLASSVSQITYCGITGSGGTVVESVSPTLTTPNIGAATGTSLLVTGNIDGTAPVTVTTGTTATLGGTFKSGYTINEEGTAATAVAYTLPTAAVGLQYCVANGWNGTAATTGVLTLATSASGQFIIFTDGTLSATGGNVTSGGAAADATCVIGVDSTHWQLYVQRGTWTKH